MGTRGSSGGKQVQIQDPGPTTCSWLKGQRANEDSWMVTWEVTGGGRLWALRDLEDCPLRCPWSEPPNLWIGYHLWQKGLGRCG